MLKYWVRSWLTGVLVNSRWVGSGYGRWHGRWNFQWQLPVAIIYLSANSQSSLTTFKVTTYWNYSMQIC